MIAPTIPTTIPTMSGVFDESEVALEGDDSHVEDSEGVDDVADVLPKASAALVLLEVDVVDDFEEVPDDGEDVDVVADPARAVVVTVVVPGPESGGEP